MKGDDGLMMMEVALKIGGRGMREEELMMVETALESGVDVVLFVTRGSDR